MSTCYPTMHCHVIKLNYFTTSFLVYGVFSKKKKTNLHTIEQNHLNTKIIALDFHEI